MDTAQIDRQETSLQNTAAQESRSREAWRGRRRGFSFSGRLSPFRRCTRDLCRSNLFRIDPGGRSYLDLRWVQRDSTDQNIRSKILRRSTAEAAKRGAEVSFLINHEACLEHPYWGGGAQSKRLLHVLQVGRKGLGSESPYFGMNRDDASSAARRFLESGNLTIKLHDAAMAIVVAEQKSTFEIREDDGVGRQRTVHPVHGLHHELPSLIFGPDVGSRGHHK